MKFRFESSYPGESLNCPSVGYKQAAMTATSLTSPLSGLWAMPTCLVMPAGTKHLSAQCGQVSGGLNVVRSVFKLGILIHRKSDSWVSHWKSVHRFNHETLPFW